MDLVGYGRKKMRRRRRDVGTGRGEQGRPWYKMEVVGEGRGEEWILEELRVGYGVNMVKYTVRNS